MNDTPRSLLIRIAETPSEDDWRRLVDLYQPFICRWLGQAGVPESDSPDLGQDVLTAVIKDVPSFRHSERTGAFRKWLRTVVVNRTRQYWRTKQTRPIQTHESAVLDALEDPDSGLSGEWDREHDAHVARQLLAALEGEFSPSIWLAFRRQVMDGQSASETAAELGLTVNAVLIAKSRVLRRFREESAGILSSIEQDKTQSALPLQGFPFPVSIMALLDHPTEERLTAFGLGRLSEADSTEIENHLADCDTCQSTLNLVPDDPIVRLVRTTQPAGKPANGHSTTRAHYRTLRMHARGGLGEVTLARDETIGRDVAVKRLLPNSPDNPQRHRRFLREAVVTGRLEHPGIAPVYGVGEDETGRPCYAMRFVPGQTLLDAIRELHSKPGPDRDIRPLLGRFVSLCNTVAYAHSRGVIHRDIKPANVAVGPYGETILLDWGLAQLADDPTVAGHDRVEMPPPYERFETVTGTVLGTPGYMAPEQAAGRTVGPHADVYSLGATLLSLLTGRSPNEPDTGATAPPLLLAIARKAMAESPDDRYPTAAALAADVESWLFDRPIQGVPEPTMVRLGRWSRRHRTFVAGLTAATFVAAVGFGIAAALISSKNVDLGNAIQLAKDNEATANLNAEKMQDALTLASEREVEAVKNFRIAMDAVDRFTNTVSEDQRLITHDLLSLRKELLLGAGTFFQELATRRPDTPELKLRAARAHCRLGNIYKMTNDPARGLKEYQTSLALLADHAELRTAESWVIESNVERGLSRVHFEQREFDVAIEHARKSVAAMRSSCPDGPLTSSKRAELADTEYLLAMCLAQNVKRPGTDEAFARAIELLRQNRTEQPRDPDSWRLLPLAILALGGVQMREGKIAEGEALYAEARDLLKTVPEDKLNDENNLRMYLAQTLCDLGKLYRQQNRLEEAEGQYREALAAASRMVDQHPRTHIYKSAKATALFGLGDAIARRGKPAEAEKLLRESLTLRIPLFAATPNVLFERRSLILCHTALAQALFDLNRAGEAVEQIRQAEPLHQVGLNDQVAAQSILTLWCRASATTEDRDASDAAFERALALAKAYSKPQTASYACQLLNVMKVSGLFDESRRIARLNDKEFESISTRAEFQRIKKK